MKRNSTMKAIVIVMVAIITCLSGSFTVNAAGTIDNISEGHTNVMAVEEVEVNLTEENTFFNVNEDDCIDSRDVYKMEEILIQAENASYQVKDLVYLVKLLQTYKTTAEETPEKEISSPAIAFRASDLNPNKEQDCYMVMDIIKNGTVSVEAEKTGWRVVSNNEERLAFLFFDELTPMSEVDNIFTSFKFDGCEYYVWIGGNQFHLYQGLTSPIVGYNASKMLATNENIDLISKTIENADRITVDSNEFEIRVTCVGRDNAGITELRFEYWTQICEDGKYIFILPAEAIMPFEVKAPEEGLWPMFEVDGQKYVIWFDYNASQFYLTKVR